MEWVPVVFVIFKTAALALAMFFAIKWHYDQARNERRSVLRVGGVMATIFMLSVMAVVFFAFFLSSMLGLDLGF